MYLAVFAAEGEDGNTLAPETHSPPAPIADRENHPITKTIVVAVIIVRGVFRVRPSRAIRWTTWRQPSFAPANLPGGRETQTEAPDGITQNLRSPRYARAASASGDSSKHAWNCSAAQLTRSSIRARPGSCGDFFKESREIPTRRANDFQRFPKTHFYVLLNKFDDIAVFIAGPTPVALACGDRRRETGGGRHERDKRP